MTYTEPELYKYIYLMILSTTDDETQATALADAIMRLVAGATIV